MTVFWVARLIAVATIVMERKEAAAIGRLL